MKKIKVLFLVSCLGFFICGCGTKNNVEDVKNNENKNEVFEFSEISIKKNDINIINGNDCIKNNEKKYIYYITNTDESLKISYKNNFKNGSGSNFSMNDMTNEAIITVFSEGTVYDSTVNVSYENITDSNSSVFYYALFNTINPEQFLTIKNTVSYMYDENGNLINVDIDSLKKLLSETWTMDYKDKNKLTEHEKLYYEDLFKYYGYNEILVLSDTKDGYIVGFYSKKINDKYRIDIVTEHTKDEFEKLIGTNKIDNINPDKYKNVFCDFDFVEQESIKQNFKELDEYYVVVNEYDGDFQQEVFGCERYIELVDDCHILLDDIISADLLDGKIISFDEYSNICDKFNFDKKYRDDSKNYFCIFYGSGTQFLTFKVIDLINTNEKLDFYYYEDLYGVMGSGSGTFVAIPIDKSITDINMIRCYTEEEIETINNPAEYKRYMESCDKPVIYFYPEKDNFNVNVKLNLDGKINCTYPKYEEGWNIICNKNGIIRDENGLEYNYLYWEGQTNTKFDFSKGFCVKGEDTAKFLEEYLPKLGLNRKEANEFIVYWLPLMQDNKFNIISFQSDRYTNSAKLNINPEPDTLIRVFMTYYESDEFIDIDSQDIVTPERKGFTVVEWGGSNTKNIYKGDKK